MSISFSNRIKAFSALGKKLKAVVAAVETNNEALAESPAQKKVYNEIIDAPNQNPWFTLENVKLAVSAISEMLEADKLEKWVESYVHLFADDRDDRAKVAVVMAGNIPLVGFHDFMCSLVAGHRFLGKLSSQDKKLPVAVADLLIESEPGLGESIEFSEGPVSGFDAVIATGSNNSARYFEHYFGKYPHIIRKNRNSVAVLTGRESIADLQQLGKDVFSYFGLGCRNVSKLLVPAGYDFTGLKKAWEAFRPIAEHHKFFNNYEYFKAVYLINRTPFTDFDFCLLKEDASFSSPVSVIYFEEYSFADRVPEYLEKNSDKIQCVASNEKWQGINTVSFGQCQKPGPGDYADGIDTMLFLAGLKGHTPQK